MPYTPSHIAHELARGRPMPTGSPDPKLVRALEQGSPMDMETAIHQGANPGLMDGRGRTAFHILFDRAILPHGRLSMPMERLMACCRVLLRAPADVMRLHPSTGESVLQRTAELAAHPQALTWHAFWQGARRGSWTVPERPGQPSALAAWHAKASPSVKARLPPLPEPAIEPPPRRTRRSHP